LKETQPDVASLFLSFDMDRLTVNLVQFDIEWESPSRNLSKLDDLLAQAPPADLIVLPEMFSTGFSMRASSLAEPMNGDTVRWMKDKAQELTATVTGSLIIQEDGRYFNRLLWVPARGEIEHYDKKHLFGYGGETKVYSSGSRRLNVSLKGWQIMPLICYDLRFPVWCRNDISYDLLLFVANFPAARIEAWDKLLQARAIENLSYVVAVNRTGAEPTGIEYNGHTSVIDYVGKSMFCAGDDEVVHHAVLEMKDLKDFREAYPFLKDRDSYEIL
jgi:omega-amidase